MTEMFVLLELVPEGTARLLGIYPTEDQAVDCGYAWGEKHDLSHNYLEVHHVTVGGYAGYVVGEPLWSLDHSAPED